jgi:hypothetical protein
LLGAVSADDEDAESTLAPPQEAMQQASNTTNPAREVGTMTHVYN